MCTLVYIDEQYQLQSSVLLKRQTAVPPFTFVKINEMIQSFPGTN